MADKNKGKQQEDFSDKMNKSTEKALGKAKKSVRSIGKNNESSDFNESSGFNAFQRNMNNTNENE